MSCAQLQAAVLRGIDAASRPIYRPWFQRTTVGPDAARPAGAPDECLYCRAKVGHDHTRECHYPTRPVMTELMRNGDRVVLLVIDMPIAWEVDMLWFGLNESSGCKNNHLRYEGSPGYAAVTQLASRDTEVAEVLEAGDDGGCLCRMFDLRPYGYTPTASGHC